MSILNRLGQWQKLRHKRAGAYTPATRCLPSTFVLRADANVNTTLDDVVAYRLLYSTWLRSVPGSWLPKGNLVD